MSFGLKLSFKNDATLMRFDSRLKELGNPDLRDLLENIGSEVESQTRYRISVEKKAPDGSEWPDWSEDYAKNKHGRRKHSHPGALRSSGGHSMLELDGELLNSIQYEVQSNAVLVGSNKVYARSVDSLRSFIGLSRQNIEDIKDLTADFLEARLR